MYQVETLKGVKKKLPGKSGEDSGHTTGTTVPMGRVRTCVVHVHVVNV